MLAVALALVLMDAGSAAAAGTAGGGAARAQPHGWAGPFLGQAAAVSGPDIWGKDNIADTGVEASSDPVFTSPDIRLKTTSVDGPHENEVNGVNTNFVFITVRNRGDEPVTRAEIHLYWTVFGGNANWLSDWHDIGSTFVVNVAPHSDQVVGPIAWKPPHSGHYCLLVRMVPDPPVDQIVGETTSTKQNVKDHNNIIWTNVTIYDAFTPKPHNDPVQIVNADATPGKYNVKFREPHAQRADSLVNHARVVVDLQSLAAQLRRGKVAVRGMTRIRGSWYRITDLKQAAVTGIMLKPRARVSIGMSFRATAAKRGKHYSLDVVQQRVVRKRARDDGGVRFELAM